MTVDKRELALWLLEWETKYKDLQILESLISDAISEMQETYTVGHVRATYNSGVAKYDYETACKGKTTMALLKLHTSTVTKTDWKSIADALNLDKENIPSTKSAPSVKIKLIGD